MASFAKKIDLDNQVLNYRARLKSDYERKLRAKNFAKLYYLNKEYSKALKYLSEFMSVKNDDSTAYRLQGKIQEALVERDNAVQSYMKSLELDPSQTDLFDKIMDLIPYSNLEPDRVKLWTERFQSSKKDSELLEKTKICSPCSPPGNTTLDILNNSLNDPGTPSSIRNPDLNVTGRSDDIHSTPNLSNRFVSPKALSPYGTKINFEKIEKELIVLSQAQEGLATNIDKVLNEVSKANSEVSKTNSEILNCLKGIQKNLENLSFTISRDLTTNLTGVKDSINKQTEMMDKMMKSQVNLEDAVYELTESYGGDTQGDGPASVVNDSNRPMFNQPQSFANTAYSSQPDPHLSTLASSSRHIPEGSASEPPMLTSFPIFNPNSENKNTLFPMKVASSSSERALPTTTTSMQGFQPSTWLNPVQQFSIPSLASSSSQISQTHLPSTQSFPTSVATSNLNPSVVNCPDKPLSALWQPKGWECNACYTRNSDIAKACVACETPKPGLSPAPAQAFVFGVPDSKPMFPFASKSQLDENKDVPAKFDSPANAFNFCPSNTSQNSSISSSSKSDFSFKLDSSLTSSGSPSFPQFKAGAGSNVSSPFGDVKLPSDTKKSPLSQPSIFGNTKSETQKEGQNNVSIFGNIKDSSTFTFTGGFSFNAKPNPNDTSTRDAKPSNIAAKDVDLEVIYVKEPKSREAAEKALKLRLPINFFDYENAEPCPGCRGCDEETPLDKLISQNASQPAEPTLDLEKNLFAAAIEKHGTVKTNWETGAAQWTSITAPAPIFQKSSKTDDEENFATGEDGGGSENAVFKLPTIQMPDIVEVKTGEEDEEPLFVSRAKVFLFSEKDKEWKERGIGDFKILKHPANNTYRMLLRRDKVLKIACNQRISPSTKFEPMESSENALTWAGVDFSEQPERMGMFSIRFKNSDIKKEFLNRIESVKAALALVEQSNTKDKNSSPSALNLKSKGEHDPNPSRSPKGPDSSENLFAQAIADNNTAKTDWESTASDWEIVMKPQPLFQRNEPKEGDEYTIEGGEDAGGSETAVFKLPTISMPDIVEVKTGEEEEEPLFVTRAKVFLYSEKDKEWKERGVGDFKVLKHPTNNTYRMLLRRDKVLKIACNQRITSAISFEPFPSSSNSLTWAGVDFSEQPEKKGLFCIKFKNQDIKSGFLSIIDQVQGALASSDQSMNKSSDPVEYNS